MDKLLTQRLANKNLRGTSWLEAHSLFEALLILSS